MRAQAEAQSPLSKQKDTPVSNGSFVETAFDALEQPFE